MNQLTRLAIQGYLDQNCGAHPSTVIAIPFTLAEWESILRDSPGEAPHEGRYKDWCLRLNCARIGMDNAAICKVLDEIDGYFHSQQGGH